MGVMGNANRLFDPRWLESSSASSELVGVDNRLDWRPFQDGAWWRDAARLLVLAERHSPGTLGQIAVSVQSVCWLSTIKPDLGCHAQSHCVSAG